MDSFISAAGSLAFCLKPYGLISISEKEKVIRRR